MPKVVDLRSDTVTRPVPGMREAIAGADVGDDVFGDDPTVIRLERRAASLFGTEAAMFVPSGTMGNTVAIAAITAPGDELILDRLSHIFNNEVAAVPVICGVQFNAIDGTDGVVTAEQIATRIRPVNLHQPVSRVIAVENTHNWAGGRVFPLDEMRRIKELAGANGMKVHLDGARLANAVVATGISFDTWVACADTVNMCFSKGLGAPVGSVVGADEATIARARKKRKQLGGGMRQAGVVAAAALFALDHHVERLQVDHDNAARLAGVVGGVEGLELAGEVETNMVMFRVDPSLGTRESFLERLAERGVLAGTAGPLLVRMVTHLDVDSTGIDYVAEVLGSLKPA
ncbi:MAG: threonine aldolase family protein [Candidatus Krumholzibacteriia bacterium]